MAGPRPSRLKAWIFTTNHKQIGILYFVTAWISFAMGGLMALLVRLELWDAPADSWVYAETYTQLFTVHAITMIFLFVMPLGAAFGNYFIPLMIGAKDMAYPRINAFSYWLIPPAILLVWCGFLFHLLDIWFGVDFLTNIKPVATGWTTYVPLSGIAGSPSFGTDLWLIAIVLLGTASTMGAINFIATIIKLRRPGMTLHHIPLFAWSWLVTAVLLLLATPPLTVGVLALLLDRNFGTTFFVHQLGGDVITWQHLFWFFGHPEVYILILPAMGVINEILPRFTGKPIFGYHAMAWSMVGIGFLGFVVYGHHMFTTGIDPRVRATFMAMTMAIGIPTGIKIFNWLATLWKGVIEFKAPLLFAVGFISMFVIGGINGVYTASIPVDYKLHDTYWVVSHIHYVLFGGAAMGLFAATYYWWPVLTGRMYSEKLALWHFILTIVGQNLVFFTMHFIGLEGMPRGAAEYRPQLETLNQVATIGAFLLGAAQLLFFWNMIWSVRRGPKAVHNPWKAEKYVLEFTEHHYPAHSVDPIVFIAGQEPEGFNERPTEKKAPTTPAAPA